MRFASRLLAIEKGMIKYKNFSTFLKLFVGLLIAWIWAIIWNTPPLIFWDGYDPEGFGTTCAPNWFVKDFGYDH